MTENTASVELPSEPDHQEYDLFDGVVEAEPDFETEESEETIK